MENRKKIIETGNRNYADITAFGKKDTHCWGQSPKEN